MSRSSVSSPIGVFDSGVGGLTVFQALERALPGESFIYLGDTARVPYGNKSRETIVRYSLEAARFLTRHRIKMMVVACNSASSAALGELAQALRVPVLGVIEPGARRAATLSRTGRIGVIGTRATIQSGAYTRAIQALRADAKVTSRACPLFVPLAEEGWTESGDDVAHRVAARYLAPLREANVDVLVLGCTHYPLLAGVIGDVMGPAVRLVDSASAVAAEVRERVDTDPGGVAARHCFYVTDVPGPFQEVAERFLGRPIERLEQASLND